MVPFIQCTRLSPLHLNNSRALVLFCAMVSGYDTVHIRSNIPRLEEAIRYGESAGDRCASPFFDSEF